MHHGWVEIDGGKIVALGAGRARVPQSIDLGSVAVLPGLVNAHTHLELSHLHDRVPPATDFVQWIRGVIESRRTRPDPRSEEIMGAIHAGIAQSVSCGTALVGDISNTLATYGPLSTSVLAGVFFYELIRFNAPEPDAVVADACRQLDALPQAPHVRASLAAHAPYSVAPAVFRSIHEAVARSGRGPVSVHLAESAAESEFIARGTGPWRQFLEDVGAWASSWTPSGTTSVEYLDALHVLDARSLVVHGVQMTTSDLAILEARGSTLVTCPRSNRHTGAGTPPIAAFYASGVRVAVGTDSLASTGDLSVFSELAAMRAIAPSVTAASLLESATRHGADALGFGADYGTIEPGKRGRLIAVSVPPDVDDVEQYLVGGITPEQIHWIDA